MRRNLLFILPFLFISLWAEAQTSLKGKITEEGNDRPVGFSNVAIYKDGILLTGTFTDDLGNYNFPDIDPGVYDVEASFTGFQTKKVSGVQVLAGKVTTVDIAIGTDGGVLLETVEVVYEPPLIEQDNTTSGTIVTGETIKNLPTRNINSIVALSAGTSSADDGGAITVRGARSDGTLYIVDGIPVRGALIPESEIEQLQVITGGLEAQYGDATGGIISITTKGPSNQFTGRVDVESSQLTDPYNWNLYGFNFSGPILKNKNTGRSILGFRLSGRYQDRLDDDPSAVPIYRINDESLAALEANPILPDGSSFLPAADFYNNDNVNAQETRPFENSSLIDLNTKIDARLSNAIDLAFTGAYRESENQFAPSRGWYVYNSHNNPIANSSTLRGNFRFRHRLGGGLLPSAGSTRSKGLIQNASYTLQFGYEKVESDDTDQRHGFNYFDYGHVGNFDIEWVPTFAFEFDPESQQVVLNHTDYRQVLRGYENGTSNPVLANYNNAMNLATGEPLNGDIGDFIITGGGNDNNLLARGQFVAPNGQISSIFNNSWGFHTNVGTVYNRASFSQNEIYTFNGKMNFDLVPGGSDKGRHNIQLGIFYEQRIGRSHTVFPRSLWDVARQQVNNHIQGIEEGAATVGSINIEGIGDVDLKEVSIETGEDNRFFRAIRDELGVPLNQYVNVDGLDPSQLRLDMFSAKELNDQNLISYIGTDYLGNPFDGTFDDFFTATDADGVRTFPVAPNRPIYTAAYIQDKFTFDDIIFRLGVRIDRYDANTKVLKDPFSLYEIMGAEEYHTNFGGDRPGNIGDDFAVYLNDGGTDVQAYRDGEQWYEANGTPVNDAIEIFSGNLVFPKYKDQRVEDNPNFIKSRDFDPNVSFEDYEAQVNIMPRLAFSFPISEEANFFAHYDILVQRPASNTLATARDYFYFTDFPGITKNNPDLRPSRTIDYEVGFQQKLSETSKLKLSAYYRELRDMIQFRTYFPVPIIGQYTTYDNQDFGTVKGFSFEYELRRTSNISLLANYTLQFADGTGSGSNSQRGLTSRGNLRNLFPLTFDERHRVNVNMDFRYRAGRFYNGPTLNGIELLSNFGVNVQTVAVSGRPYTATLTPLELGGAQIAGALNGARKPWTFATNLRVDKAFTLTDKLGLNVYCRISNLFDRRNVINVYSATGSPEDDGFLESSNGLDKIQNIENSNRLVESYFASYQWAILNPNFYSLPRRIYLGAILNF